MPGPDPSTARKEALVRQAARIFLRLRHHPDDQAAQEARDAFIASGEAERRAYESVSRATGAVETRDTRQTKRLYGLVFLAGILTTLALNFDRAVVMMHADFRTGRDDLSVELASGDRVVLDAASAIIDDSAKTTRQITLLEGAGFFEVDQDGRRFIVAANGIEAEALGTAFEVSQVEGATYVSVQKGHVEVRALDSVWQLRDGQRLIWRGDVAAEVEQIPAAAVAGWREDHLDLTGMSFGEVVDVIDRRIPGRVFFTNAELAQTELSGGLDLSDPQAALSLLAVTQNARIRLSSPLGSLISR